MPSAKLLVVVGSGPGIGVSTASLFASRGFNIALISRNAQRLEQDVQKVQAASKTSDIQVKPFPADVGDQKALKETLEKVKQAMGSPEVVLFNAARIAETTIGETEPGFLLDDFKTMSVGLYVTAIWALPLLAERTKDLESHPSFLMTGGGIHDHPDPVHFSLSMQKAAQYNLAGSLSQVAGPKGIHVATVVVGGVVSDDDPVINAKNIAEQFGRLYQQSPGSWESTVMVGDIEDLIRKSQQ